MNIKPIVGAALGISVVLALSSCAGGAAPDPETPSDAAPAAEYYLDPAEEQISEAAAQRITELYDAALAAGEDELSIISGTSSELVPTFELFESTFPGITVTYADVIGAALTTQLQNETQSGNHTTDVLHNPNGQQYVGFAQPYEVVGLEVPGGLASSTKELVDPGHLYTSPFIGAFGLGVFLPREQAQQLTPPSLWSDLAQPEYQGQFVMGDPRIPGPSQDAPIYLAEVGALDEAQIDAIAKATVLKGTYGDAIAALMQGEAAYMFGAPVGGIVRAGKSGAPVEFRLMDEGNYVVTHKMLLLDRAPHPNVGKLFLEWLNTFSAQQQVGLTGQAPLNTAAADPTQPWSNWETMHIDHIVPAETIDGTRAAWVDKFKTLFG